MGKFERNLSAYFTEIHPCHHYLIKVNIFLISKIITRKHFNHWTNKYSDWHTSQPEFHTPSSTHAHVLFLLIHKNNKTYYFFQSLSGVSHNSLTHSIKPISVPNKCENEKNEKKICNRVQKHNLMFVTRKRQQKKVAGIYQF